MVQHLPSGAVSCKPCPPSQAAGGSHSSSHTKPTTPLRNAPNCRQLCAVWRRHCCRCVLCQHHGEHRSDQVCRQHCYQQRHRLPSGRESEGQLQGHQGPDADQGTVPKHYRQPVQAVHGAGVICADGACPPTLCRRSWCCYCRGMPTASAQATRAASSYTYTPSNKVFKSLNVAATH